MHFKCTESYRKVLGLDLFLDFNSNHVTSGSNYPPTVHLPHLPSDGEMPEPCSLLLASQICLLGFVGSMKKLPSPPLFFTGKYSARSRYDNQLHLNSAVWKKEGKGGPRSPGTPRCGEETGSGGAEGLGGLVVVGPKG